MASMANSPIMIFLFFHKAIRSELDWLHYAITTFLTDSHREINPLFERYCFLRTIYQHHCNAEDKCGLKKQKDSLLRNKNMVKSLSGLQGLFLEKERYWVSLFRLR